jgi:hypothetical protein
VVFTVPLENLPRRGWLAWLRRRAATDAATSEMQ